MAATKQVASQNLAITLSICGLCILIYAPIVIYYLIRFRRYSSLMVVKKRFPGYVTVTSIVVVLYYLLAVPFLVVTPTLDSSHVSFASHFNRIHYVLYPVFTTTILYLIAHRCWHILYKAHWYKAELNSEWKFHLNRDLVACNFWLRNKNTFGNCYFTRRVTIVWCVLNIISLVGMFQYYLSKYDAHIILMAVPLSLTLTSFLLPVVLIIVFYAMAPTSCTDTFHIRAEFKRLALVACAHVIGFAGCCLFKYFGPRHRLFIEVAFVLVSATAYFAYSLVQTRFIYRHISCSLYHFNRALEDEAHDKDSNANLKSADIGFLFGEFEPITLDPSASVSRIVYHGRGHNDASPLSTLPSTMNGLKIPSLQSIQMHSASVRNGGEHDVTTTEFAKKVRLHHVMQRADTFEMLMRHLASEYSQEIMLCMLEIIQWKRWLFVLYERINDGKTIETNHCHHRCILSDVMPTSSIMLTYFFDSPGKLKNMKDNDELVGAAKRAAHELAVKYVNVGSGLEINIADGARRHICGICGDLDRFLNISLDIAELFGMFDGVAEELHALANHSFVRFKSKPEWAQMLYMLSNSPLNE